MSLAGFKRFLVDTNLMGMRRPSCHAAATAGAQCLRCFASLSAIITAAVGHLTRDRGNYAVPRQCTVRRTHHGQKLSLEGAGHENGVLFSSGASFITAIGRILPIMMSGSSSSTLPRVQSEDDAEEKFEDSEKLREVGIASCQPL